MIIRHTLAANAVKSFPETVAGNRLIFETKVLSAGIILDGKAIGEVVISATVEGITAVEVGRQKLIPGDRPLFLVPEGISGPFQLTGELFPWIEGKYLITVWASHHETTGDVNGGNGTRQTDAEPIDFVPMPSSHGMDVGPGRAVYVAGDDDFWKLGVISSSQFSDRRFRFGAGSGRAVFGLSPSFSVVSYRLVRWAWYVHSFSEVRAFDFRDGSIANVAQFPWRPSQDLALRLEDATVHYEMLVAGAWQVLYSSPNLVTQSPYFVGVLGPNAFVFNCLKETI